MSKEAYGQKEIAEVYKATQQMFYLSTEEIVRSIHRNLDKPVLMIALIDNLYGEYSALLSQHVCYYEEFKNRIGNGDTSKNTGELCKWQKQNVDLLHRFCRGLIDYRKALYSILKHMEEYHKNRGFKGDCPWVDIKEYVKEKTKG